MDTPEQFPISARELPFKEKLNLERCGYEATLAGNVWEFFHGWKTQSTVHFLTSEENPSGPISLRIPLAGIKSPPRVILSLLLPSLIKVTLPLLNKPVSGLRKREQFSLLHPHSLRQDMNPLWSPWNFYVENSGRWGMV